MSFITCHTLLGKKKKIKKELLIPRPSVYAIIIQKQKILLTKISKTNKYFFPGGGIEKGETIKEALVREVQEETGLYITIKKFITFKEDFFYYDPEKKAFHGLLLFFECRPAKQQKELKNKKKEQWLNINSIKKSDILGVGWQLIKKIK